MAALTIDETITPPKYKNPFRGASDKGADKNYPATSGYQGQRRVFAGTDAYPQRVWMSRVGDFNDYSSREPIQDDDVVQFDIAAAEANEIFGTSTLGQLILFTGGAVWTAEGDGNGSLTPSAINLKGLSYEGSASLRPLEADDQVIYAEARGRFVRELTYDVGSGGYSGYKGRDLTIWASHLFEGHTIVDWAFARIPTPTMWVVRSDGALLGFTYIPDHDVWAWHRHDTGDDSDLFKSVAVVPEGNGDTVYCTVARLVGGSTSYYIERMAPRKTGDEPNYDVRSDDKFFDSYLTYDGTNATATTLTITGGSTWAAGETGLTLTASAGLFGGDSDDVGTGYRIVGADGLEAEVEITAHNNTTVATVKLLTAAPTSTRSARSTWVAMVRSVSGLTHLEAETVYALADGVPLGPFTVSSGAVAISTTRPYGIVHVGLQITATIETLDVDYVSYRTGQDAVADRTKNVKAVTLFLRNSIGVTAGHDAATQVSFELESGETTESLVTDKRKVRLGGRVTDHGRVVVSQTSGLPAHLTGVVTHMDIGGH